jgi:hypothetical protein
VQQRISITPFRGTKRGTHALCACRLPATRTSAFFFSTANGTDKSCSKHRSTQSGCRTCSMRDGRDLNFFIFMLAVIYCRLHLLTASQHQVHHIRIS